VRVLVGETPVPDLTSVDQRLERLDLVRVRVRVRVREGEGEG